MSWLNVCQSSCFSALTADELLALQPRKKFEHFEFAQHAAANLWLRLRANSVALLSRILLDVLLSR